jgi:protein involved in polysaccharide export with SLBB domain
MFAKYLSAVLVFAAALFISSAPELANAQQMDRLPVGSQLTAEQLDAANVSRLPSRGLPSSTAEDGPAPSVEPSQPQSFDYSANLNSDTFGANLFTGAFARQAAAQFNPNYVINIGDSIRVRLWGAFEFQASLTVDPQGNIFLPNVGPVHLLGVRNKDLQTVVDTAIGKVFRSNVFSYASLAAAQPVRVYVGGFVHRPGAYAGTSMDGILHYLDQAGGIDPDRGSFLNVQVKRGTTVRATISLYDFLLNGQMPQVQLADGDVIFVGTRSNTVLVSGLAENAKRFEFLEAQKPLSALVAMARPLPSATHVRVVRNTGVTRNVEYYPLAGSETILIQDGDELAFTADKKPGTITVRVEGEHESPQEYVLPYGTHLGELLSKIEYSSRSDQQNLQLFRESVKARQKELLQVSLRALETAALTARSGTSDEARLRQEEADLILRWVDRAKKVEPNGQVVISQSADAGDLLLENGDILRVPVRDGLVLVSGEVLFPNAVAFSGNLSVRDYIERAGGFTNKADTSRIIVARQDGSFAEAKPNSKALKFGSRTSSLDSGDEILVLPRIDVKSRQIFKDMTQILYQIAIGAQVALGI